VKAYKLMIDFPAYRLKNSALNSMIPFAAIPSAFELLQYCARDPASPEILEGEQLAAILN
jgi:hypothetical protein